MRDRLAVAYNSVLQRYPYATWFLFRWLYDFKLERWNETVTVTDGVPTRMRLLPFYAISMLAERRGWDDWYGTDHTGQTVLDVGAGCGETAWFFLKHGAKKVIAVEPDPQVVAYLHENAERNHWNIEIIPEKFSVSHLKIPHDYLKMDGYGCEVALLDESVKELGKCYLEMYPKYIGEEPCRRIIDKFGLKLVSDHCNMIAVSDL